jgi:flagellar protein FlbD
VIQLTRLNGAPFVVNAELIEQLEVTPDTVITLTSGTILVVQESLEKVVREVIEYHREIRTRWGDTPEQSGTRGSAA